MRICTLWERIHKSLAEDLWGFMRIHKTGRGFTRIQETLGEDLQDFGRGFTRICEDSQGFMRIWESIHKDL